MLQLFDMALAEKKVLSVVGVEPYFSNGRWG